MGRITAYECDLCGKVSKDPLPFTVRAFDNDTQPTYTFEVEDSEPSSYEKGCCSLECIRVIFSKWLFARAEQRRLEAEKEAADKTIKDASIATVKTKPIAEAV